MKDHRAWVSGAAAAGDGWHLQPGNIRTHWSQSDYSGSRYEESIELPSALTSWSGENMKYHGE
jgi:hypothetical protein